MGELVANDTGGPSTGQEQGFMRPKNCDIVRSTNQKQGIATYFHLRRSGPPFLFLLIWLLTLPFFLFLFYCSTSSLNSSYITSNGF